MLCIGLAVPALAYLRTERSLDDLPSNFGKHVPEPSSSMHIWSVSGPYYVLKRHRLQPCRHSIEALVRDFASLHVSHSYNIGLFQLPNTGFDRIT